MWIITTMKNVGIGVGKKNYWQDGQVLYWLIISVLYMYLRDWKNQFQIEANWIWWYNEKEMINSCNDMKGINNGNQIQQIMEEINRWKYDESWP